MELLQRKIAGGSIAGLHCYDELEFIIVYEGSFAVTVDGEEYFAEGGDVVFVGSGVPHSTRYVLPSRTGLIQFRENDFLSSSITKIIIDRVPELLKNNIPIFMAAGDVYKVVPCEENGAYLEKYYKENGGIIEVVMKEGVGHHPHCLPDNTPIVEFIKKYYF